MSWDSRVVSGRVPWKALDQEGTGYGIRRELAELVAHHILGNGHVIIDFAVVHLELEANEVGQDGC